MTPIQLISTDFDCTLVDHSTDPSCPSALIERISSLQENGTLWAINTGRSLEFTLEGLQSHNIPIVPDFILTNERDVFRPVSGGKQWEPFGDWNHRCSLAHGELYRKTLPLLDSIFGFVTSRTAAEVVIEGGRFVGIVASSEDELNDIEAEIRRRNEGCPEFSFQRNGVYMRFCHSDYHKGSALGELGRLTGITPEVTFAAGDNLNDLTMLDGRYARLVTCPSNSLPEVKTVVRQAGGYVGSSPCGFGVLEALDYFMEQPIPSTGRNLAET